MSQKLSRTSRTKRALQNEWTKSLNQLKGMLSSMVISVFYALPPGSLERYFAVLPEAQMLVPSKNSSLA